MKIKKNSNIIMSEIPNPFRPELQERKSQYTIGVVYKCTDGHKYISVQKEGEPIFKQGVCGDNGCKAQTDMLSINVIEGNTVIETYVVTPLGEKDVFGNLFSV
jgi:hypothetical protein